MSTKFDSTYSAVVSMAEQMVGEGKYDSTYSAVLAIYQNLTSDMDTKFDSVYSIVVKIADGIESGEIDLGGGGSGGSDFDGSPKIRFFSGMGQLVEEWDFETAKTKTELPAFHTIEPLLTQTGWNADFDDINWAIEHNTDLAVGALYRPKDGKTHIVIDIKPENLNTVLFIQMLEGFEIDWGDGAIEDVDTINGYPQHTYDSPGTKDIKISGNWNPHWGVGGISLTAKTYNGFPNSYYFQQINYIYCGVKLGYYWFKCLGNLKYLTFVEDEVVYDSNQFDFTGCDNLKIISLPKGSGTISLSKVRNYNIEVICNPVDLNIGASFDVSYYSSNYTVLPQLKYINIPYSVNSFGHNALFGCASLQSINIPDSVTSIGNSVFYNCYSLQSITIPNSVTSIGNSALFGCASLQSINIPDSVTSISNSAFRNCYSLQSVNIGNSVTSIGDSMFFNCYSLQSITIPNSVTSIGSSAFQDCYSLQSITIPNSVTSIGNGVFYDCYSLQSITIPNSVTSIDNSAFYGCASLQSINIPDGVTSIGNQMFYNCQSLQSINIPDSVTSIGNSAFYQCIYLTLDFTNNTQVPSLSSYSSLESTFIILVPSTLYDEWISATNWSSRASQIIAV